MNELELKLELEKIKFDTKKIEMEQKALLHKKFANLKRMVSEIEKGGRNTMQNFDYITYGQMYAKVSNLLEKVGLDITASIKDVKENTFKNKKGNDVFNITIEGEISVVDTDTGYSELHKWFSQGFDFGDKALTKANTFLMKSWLQSNLLIASDKDPDGETIIDSRDEPIYVKYPYSDKEKLSIQLVKLINRNIITQNDVLSFMEKNKISKIDNVENKEYAYKSILGE